MALESSSSDGGTFSFRCRSSHCAVRDQQHMRSSELLLINCSSAKSYKQTQRCKPVAAADVADLR